jgi:uncharacterized membrane protein YukC
MVNEEIKTEEIAKELERMQYEEWLPVESKLVKWCIGLGIVLLIILIWISYTFFPAQ